VAGRSSATLGAKLSPEAKSLRIIFTTVNASRAVLGVSIAAYTASLFVPVLFLARTQPHSWGRGIEALLFGWLGYLDDTTSMLAWFANLAFILGWILSWTRAQKSALTLAVVSVSLMVPFHKKTTILSLDAGGVVEKIAGFGLGYWLWVASAIALNLAVCIAFVRLAIRNPTSLSSAEAPNPRLERP